MEKVLNDMGNLKNLKNYKFGIIIGILSIITSLLITGVPIGPSPIELINIAIYILGIIPIIVLAIKKKNDKLTLIALLLYLAIIFSLTIIIEKNYSDFKLYAIGWIPGFIMSLIGLLRSKDVKKTYNIRACMALSIIGLIISIISLILVIPNGGFILGK